MEKKDISTKALTLKDSKDLLLLLNQIHCDEMGDQVKSFELSQIEHFSNPENSSKNYTHFTIPKKTGGKRQISTPIKELKCILHYLNIIIRSIYTPLESALGFVEGKSVVDNAKLHINKNFVFNIDLKDFFPSISQSRVSNRFKREPFNYSDELSNVISYLCCMRSSSQGGDSFVLPQGAPTSPIITNMVCDDLDRELMALAARFGLTYSRYADDITFSSMHNVYQKNGIFRIELKRIIEEYSFRINDKKTRLQRRGTRQVVTGLVVCKKPNVTKHYIHYLRSILCIWEHHGYDVAKRCFLSQYKVDKGYTIRHNPHIENVIEGKLLYLKMVKGDNDPQYLKLKQRFDLLIENSLIYTNLESDSNIQIPKYRNEWISFYDINDTTKTKGRMLFTEELELYGDKITNPDVKKVHDFLNGENSIHKVQEYLDFGKLGEKLIKNPNIKINFIKHKSFGDTIFLAIQDDAGQTIINNTSYQLVGVLYDKNHNANNSYQKSINNEFASIANFEAENNYSVLTNKHAYVKQMYTGRIWVSKEKRDANKVFDRNNFAVSITLRDGSSGIETITSVSMPTSRMINPTIKNKNNNVEGRVWLWLEASTGKYFPIGCKPKNFKEWYNKNKDDDTNPRIKEIKDIIKKICDSVGNGELFYEVDEHIDELQKLLYLITDYTRDVNGGGLKRHQRLRYIRNRRNNEYELKLYDKNNNRVQLTPEQQEVLANPKGKEAEFLNILLEQDLLLNIEKSFLTRELFESDVLETTLVDTRFRGSSFDITNEEETSSIDNKGTSQKSPIDVVNSTSEQQREFTERWYYFGNQSTYYARTNDPNAYTDSDCTKPVTDEKFLEKLFKDYSQNTMTIENAIVYEIWGNMFAIVYHDSDNNITKIEYDEQTPENKKFNDEMRATHQESLNSQTQLKNNPVNATIGNNEIEVTIVNNDNNAIVNNDNNETKAVDNNSLKEGFKRKSFYYHKQDTTAANEVFDAICDNIDDKENPARKILSIWMKDPDTQLADVLEKIYNLLLEKGNSPEALKLLSTMERDDVLNDEQKNCHISAIRDLAC